MGLEDVYRVTPKLRAADASAVDALQSWLGAPLPQGYRAYATTLGTGTYNGFLTVRMPHDIRAECAARQAFVREHFDDFWGGDGGMQRDEASRAVSFAHSVDGDEVFYSRERQRLFVLPRHAACVHWMPQGFDDPLDWRLPAASAVEAAGGQFRYFNSHRDQQIVELFNGKALQVDEVAVYIGSRLSVAHRIDAVWGVRLFLPEIHGMLQLSQAPNDDRVRIRLEHDIGCDALAAPLLDGLLGRGFRETWRHRPRAL